MTRSFHKSFLYGTVALAVMAVPALAEPGSSGRLLDLERIIEQQQQMIKNQAEAFEALKLRIETVEGRTQANTDAVVKNQAAVTAATRSVRRIDSAANPPKMVSSGNPNIKLSVSGWVNRKIQWMDDGKNDRVASQDNFNLPSRWRFLGRAKVDEKLSVGSTIEVGYSSNPSFTTGVTPNSTSDFGGANFWTRKAEVFIAHKDFGKITIGQGDPAGNTVNHNDLSGLGSMAVALPMGINFGAGGIAFTNPSNNGAPVVVLRDVFNDFDSVTRQDMARYDTPKFAGFTLGTSFIDSNGGAWDVAGRYRGKFGGINIKGAVAYTNCSACATRGGSEHINGSVAIKHSSGIAAVFGGGVRILDNPGVGRDDPTTYYVKLTYGFKANSYGTTTVGVDWQRVNDLAAQGDEADGFRLFAVQEIKKGGTNVYMSITNADLDRPGTNTDDIWTVGAGAIVTF